MLKVPTEPETTRSRKLDGDPASLPGGGVPIRSITGTDSPFKWSGFTGVMAILIVLLFAELSPVAADERLKNNIAVFAALDKVTARISHLEIKLGETVKFRGLKITPHACYSRPPTDPPETTAFVEVDDIKLNGEIKNIFTGWMFAESPGLHSVEHPVFDVWLTNCKTRSAEASAGNPKKSARRGRASPKRP